MRYQKLSDWLLWQEQLHPRRVDLGLERVRQVADNCNLLSTRARVITVAGTNGKGSTVAFLEAMLRSQGYSVGSYTSPHLQRYNERICVEGKPIRDHDLCHAFDLVDRNRSEISLSFFEFGTLAALYYFAQHDLDIILLEVGLGGRLDAVNIIDSDVAIITSIGIDHTEWLGESRESIAAEKAGIIRRNKPVVCGDFDPPQAISEIAKQKGAPLYQLNKDFLYDCDANRCLFKIDKQIVMENLPRPSLQGEMQLGNAGAAIMALQCLAHQLPVSQEMIAQGLKQVKLKGRFQVRAGDKTVIFDIAHNPHSAKALADNLQQLNCEGKTHIVLAVLSDKDVIGILKELRPVVDYLHLTELVSDRTLPVGELAETVQAYDASLLIEQHQSVNDACRRALSQMKDGDCLIICGSMITVSEAFSAGI